MKNVEDTLNELRELGDVEDPQELLSNLVAVTLVGEGGYRVRITAKSDGNGMPRLEVQRLRA